MTPFVADDGSSISPRSPGREYHQTSSTGEQGIGVQRPSANGSPASTRAGELTKISAPVSPFLEMAEIADRTAKLPVTSKRGPGGPALLFENVTGYPGATVLMNQFGSERRMKLALEADSLDAIAERIRTLLHPPTPITLVDKLKLLPTLAEVAPLLSQDDRSLRRGLQTSHHRGRRRRTLASFPFSPPGPQDGGPFITLPCVITRDPRSAKRNVRHVPHGRSTTATPPACIGSGQKNAAEQLRDRLRASTNSSLPSLASETWDRTTAAARVDLMALHRRRHLRH